jgi:hypothetical protein
LNGSPRQNWPEKIRLEKVPSQFSSRSIGWKWLEMTGKPTGSGWKVDFLASANTV